MSILDFYQDTAFNYFHKYFHHNDVSEHLLQILEILSNLIFRCLNHERDTIPGLDQNHDLFLEIGAVTEMINIKKLIHMKKIEMEKGEKLTQMIVPFRRDL